MLNVSDVSIPAAKIETYLGVVALFCRQILSADSSSVGRFFGPATSNKETSVWSSSVPDRRPDQTTVLLVQLGT